MKSTSYKPTALRRAVKGALGTSVAVPLALAAAPGLAQTTQQDMQQMQLQMQQMQDRLNSLANENQRMRQQMQQQGGQTNNPQPRSAEAPQEGFKVGDTNIQIGGYVKLDAMYDFNGDEGASLGPSDVDLDGGTNPATSFTAKQSRLKISTTTPTEIGDIGGYFELDLYGKNFDADGQYQPRFRRAYFTWNNWLFGKEWTTFSDFKYGGLVDFYGPAAQNFERQAQIRYTFNLANDSTLDLAVENPQGSSIVDKDSLASVSNDEQFPDVVARFQSSLGNLDYQASAVGIYFENDDVDDYAYGYGLDAGIAYNAPSGTTFQLTGNYGEGHAKYVYDPAASANFVPTPSAYVDGDSIEPIERGGYIVSLTQDFTDQWTGNLIWGQAFSEDWSGLDEQHKRSSTIDANIKYTPVDPLTFGLAYIRAQYTTQGGDHGNANRIHFATIYRF